MMNKEYIDFLSDKLHIQLKTIRLARLIDNIALINNIDILKIDGYKSNSLRGCDIYNGKLITPLKTSYSNLQIILHELCHILVCNPDYRHLIDVDTVKSYNLINQLSPSIYHCEQATLTLQHIIHQEYQIEPMFVQVNLSKDIDPNKTIYLSLGSTKFQKECWLDKYGHINHINLNIPHIELPEVHSIFDHNFTSGDIYYGLVHKTKNRDYTLKKFKYDGDWIDMSNNRVIKPTSIGVVSKAIF